MPPNRKARKRSVRDERASTLSGSMLQAFPADILLNLVKMLGPPQRLEIDALETCFPLLA